MQQAKEDDQGLPSVHCHIPLIPHQPRGYHLISRSQARHILAQTGQISEVHFDFAGIDQIGQAFADEIFRVFAAERPDIKLVALNANEQVMGMIRRAGAAAREQRGPG